MQSWVSWKNEYVEHVLFRTLLISCIVQSYFFKKHAVLAKSHPECNDKLIEKWQNGISTLFTCIWYSSPTTVIIDTEKIRSILQVIIKWILISSAHKIPRLRPRF